MKIYLMGLPGSGKSTIGMEMAKVLKVNFIDTDDEIINKEGRTIGQIFNEEGETYFRKLENEVLREIAKRDNAIVSTGGGTPCFLNNIDLINRHGTSLFLDVPIEVLVKRLISGKDHNRPMVKGKTEEEIFHFLKRKYEERIPYYSKASFTITSDNITLKMIMDILKLNP